MLEVGKVYTKPELSHIFGTKAKQGIDRKLERYGITFSVSGKEIFFTFFIGLIDIFGYICKN